ncbi:MAG: hypothetical protein IJC99_00165 [Clostridia bacterium]|nr:hypothetical protein [Clostridia bacterium]
MAKRRYKKNGTPSLLTVILRILIIAILCAAVVIAINRIAEVTQNHRKKEQLESRVENRADIVIARFSFFTDVV